jgi:hypothetical protein
MITSTDVEEALHGMWSAHRGTGSSLGRQGFRRRPARHIEFEGSQWRHHETAWRWRLKRDVTTSGGRWQILDLDGRPLLVLTVLAHEPSRSSEAILESNYGYAGGAVAVASAKAWQRVWKQARMSGEMRMYFLPVSQSPGEFIMALPVNGKGGARERWTRVEGWPSG